MRIVIATFDHKVAQIAPARQACMLLFDEYCLHIRALDARAKVGTLLVESLVILQARLFDSSLFTIGVYIKIIESGVALLFFLGLRGLLDRVDFFDEPFFLVH